MLCPASATSTTLSAGRRRRNSASSSSSTTGDRLPRTRSTGTPMALEGVPRIRLSARSTCSPGSMAGRPSWWRHVQVPSGSWTELCRTPRRSEDTERVGLNWTVRSRISSKVANVSGPDRKAAMSDVLSPVTPGVMSTSRSRGPGRGWRVARAMAVAPPRDMPTTARASGRQRAHDPGHVVGHGPRVEPGRVRGPVRVPVAGQVDRQQRPVERQGHGVPRVGVLAASVEQDQFRRGLAPHQRTHPPTGRHLTDSAAHGRWPVEGETRLLGVLVEQGELVVGGGGFTHGCSSSAARLTVTGGIGVRYASGRSARRSASTSSPSVSSATR